MSTRTELTGIPDSIAPWMAAPSATHRSGSISPWGVCPKCFVSNSPTRGMRVDPPTRSTRLSSSERTLASVKAFDTSCKVLFRRSNMSASNSVRVNSYVKFTGLPSTIAKLSSATVTYGWSDSLHFASSAALSKRACTCLLVDRDRFPDSLTKRSFSRSTIKASKSSPPKRLFPVVARTSTIPCSMFTMDTSNVPPPRSYTKSLAASSDPAV